MDRQTMEYIAEAVALKRQRSELNTLLGNYVTLVTGDTVGIEGTSKLGTLDEIQSHGDGSKTYWVQDEYGFVHPYSREELRASLDRQ
jgi:hypothetical protein